jgi:WD40 repeat protein/tRNA A-37 threonylcarbamoyl transferase component Bud32
VSGPPTGETPDPWGSGPFISQPPQDPASPGGPADPEAPALAEVPESERYSLGQLLGRGGMGEVRAVVDRRLQREVARKHLLDESEASRRRLAREAWLTAHLEHPGIVPIHDLGRTPDGRTYYTMRLVRGRSLARALEAAPDLEARLSLVRHVLDACEAVAFAHDAGVVHRDLKPGNVMVGSFGETLVVDWGEARIPEAHDRAAWARLGLPEALLSLEPDGGGVGTPAYTAPEQARGARPDPRSDVFSLGGILYHVLTGRPPWDGPSASGTLPAATQRRPVRIRARCPEVPAELAAIAERCLAPDPADRYPSALDLARDLERWFAGRRVLAHDYTALELLRRTAWAWRAPLAVAAAGAVLLAAGAGYAWSITQTERDRALQAEDVAVEALGEADRALARALSERAATAAGLGARPEAETLAVHALRSGPSPDARGALATFAAQSAPRRLATTPLPACTTHVIGARGQALLCLREASAGWWDLSGDSPTLRWEIAVSGPTGGVVEATAPLSLVQVLPELLFVDTRTGRVMERLASSPVQQPWPEAASGQGWTPAFGHLRSLVTVDLESGRVAGRLDPCGGGSTDAAAHHPSTDRLAMACGNGDLRIEGPEPGQVRTLETPYTREQSPSAVVWMPGRGAVLVGTLRGGVGFVDLDTGEPRPLARAPGGTVRELAPSPSGHLVAVRVDRTGVHLWDPATGLFVGRLPSGGARAVRWVNDATLDTFSGRDRTRWLLPARTGPLRYETGVGLSHAVPSPDGRLLALARGDHAVSLHEVDTGRVRLSTPTGFPSGTPACVWAAWHPAGDEVVASCVEASLMRIRAADPSRPVVRQPFPYVRRVGYLSDGRLWGASYTTGVYTTRPPAPATRWPGLDTHSQVDADSLPGASVVALLGSSGTVSLLEVGPPSRVRTRVRVPGAQVVARAADTGDLAVARSHEVHLFDAEGTPLLVLEHDATDVLDAVLTPDGTRLFTAGLDGVIRAWDLPEGTLVARMRGHSERVSKLALDAPRGVLFSASWDGSARRWGLDVLDDPVEDVARQVETRWGLTLQDALDAPLQ